MAMADYYQCDVCGGKCYYDANLNWEIDDDTGVWSLDHMGAMAAICERCAKTHEVVVQDKGGREAKQPADPEQQSSIYWVLFDATTERPYIKKLRPGGSLAFFDNESDAKRAKQNNPGTDYKRVDYYKAPQPPAEKPAVPDKADARIKQLEKTIEDHIDIMESFNGSSVPEAWDFVDEVKDAREVLKETNQKRHE